MEPEVRRGFHTLWEDIVVFLRTAGVFAGAFVLLWPAYAVSCWWIGREDAMFNGILAVGYVWMALLVVALWAWEQLVSVPRWVWLIAIPLFAIWRHMAAEERARWRTECAKRHDERMDNDPDYLSAVMDGRWAREQAAERQGSPCGDRPGGEVG